MASMGKELSQTNPPAMASSGKQSGQPENPVIFQTFEWHTPSTPPSPQQTHATTSHYARLLRVLPALSNLGISALWLPPGCKANEPHGNGYDIYDLWDLGEFDQKWARSTRWGSREELADLIKATRELGTEVLWDAVLNHKTSGDATEECWAVEVNEIDRRIETAEPRLIDAWLRYDFPGRGDTHSSLKWRAEHFSGTDWDQKRQKHAIYKLVDPPDDYPELIVQEGIQQQPNGVGAAFAGMGGMNGMARLAGKIKDAVKDESSAEPEVPGRRAGRGWAADVDTEKGNFDFLMFSNIDYSHGAPREDAMRWGEWMLRAVGVAGFRLDATRHISASFTRAWLARVHAASQHAHGRDAFIVGEIWTGELGRITAWLDAVRHGCYAFDAPLLENCARVSEDVRAASPNADLRTVFRGSLVALRPRHAVTMVASHDTQPGQTCATRVDAGLKALFYALILLREGGRPCVFWGDLYGTKGPLAEPPACRNKDGRSVLPDLILARREFAYGRQEDWFDSMACVAWTRAGVLERPGSGLVALLSITPVAECTVKKIRVGASGEVWVDVLGGIGDEMVIDREGYGVFPVMGMSAAVFVRKDAKAAGRFPVEFDVDVYGGK